MESRAELYPIAACLMGLTDSEQALIKNYRKRV